MKFIASIFALLLAGDVAAAPPERMIVLLWDKVETQAGVITEVWSSTNLVDWQWRTNVTGNTCAILANGSSEFFRIRNRLGSEVSDWARNR